MSDIPACLGPKPLGAGVQWKPPKGAWDTHFHALGPQLIFPYARSRKYSPPDAPLEECIRLHDCLGFDRGFVVHANTHGFDNSIDLDAVFRSNERYVAVVRLDSNTSRDLCLDLHASGARGVRFAFNPQHGGSLDRKAFDHVIRCIEGLGWFVELHFEGSEIPSLLPWLESIPGNVVIDHFGRVDAGLGPHQDSFQMLLALLQRGNFWIKLSGVDRISKTGAPYDDVRLLATELVRMRVDRLLWGSDWPHTGYFDVSRVPDDRELIAAFLRFVPDDAQRHQVLVDNPRALIGT